MRRGTAAHACKAGVTPVPCQAPRSAAAAGLTGAMTPTEPLLADRYRLLERIGAGGMATVWRAHDVRLGRDVAVKILRPQFADDEDFVARFEVEARHAASIAHPNVATVFDTGVEGEQQFIVMELVDGASVADILGARGAMPPGQAVDVAAAAARALAAAHRRGLIHRDVKPANILLGRDGHVRLADFGIARALTTSRVTMPGTVLGSIPYLSPEQARGEEASAAGDVFSLGVVLYEMLTGRLPWTADGPAALATVRMSEPPVPLDRARADVPAGLQRIVSRALNLDPSARYPSARAFAESLEAWARRNASTLPPEPDLAETARLVAAAPYTGAGGRDDVLVSDVATGQALAGVALARANPGGLAAPGQIVPSARLAARARREATHPRRTRPGRRRESRATGIAVAALVPLVVLAVLLLGSEALGPVGGRVLDATGIPGVAEATGAPAVAAAPVVERTPSPTLVPTPSQVASTPPTAAPTAAPATLPPHRATRPIIVVPPTAAPTAAPTVTGPREAVARFYQAAAAHDWETAVALWSPSMQRRYPPQQWLIDRFKRTTRIDLTRLAILGVDASAGTATVGVRLVEYRTVEPSPRSFAGSWDLVRLDGAWLLDEPHF
jgi:hypothetical protein